MEQFLLSVRTLKFEMWQAVLAGLIAFLGLMLFGALVDRGARVENADIVSRSANNFARVPALSRDVFAELLSGNAAGKAWLQRFEGQSGFAFHEAYEANGELLILARFDPARNRGVVEIVDLDTGDVLHDYTADVQELKRRTRQQHRDAGERRDGSLDISIIYRADEYMPRHPIVESDGSIIFGDFHTPLVKLDACSGIEWTMYGAYHHAIERDADGHYWTALREVPLVNEHAFEGFHEDTLTRFSSDGEILFEKSLTEILLENDLAFMVYPFMPYNDDPYHLNDIQPAMSDGPFWKKGDVFLSLRNQSMIILYRPSTNKVLWYKRGPWMSQHDVDIVSDNQISVFSNNAGGGNHVDAEWQFDYFVVGTNETLVYDFETDRVSSPYKSGYEALDIRTPIEGLNEILPNGDVWIEETRYGRIVVLDSSGEPRWSYVNRGTDGDVYGLNWSRPVTGAEARMIRERIEQGFDCI